MYRQKVEGEKSPYQEFIERKQIRALTTEELETERQQFQRDYSFELAEGEPVEYTAGHILKHRFNQPDVEEEETSEIAFIPFIIPKDIVLNFPAGNARADDGQAPPIVAMIYSIDANKTLAYYTNAVDLKKRIIIGKDNHRSTDIWDHTPEENRDAETFTHEKTSNRLHLSAIKRATLAEVLAWVQTTDDPRYAEYKDLTLDNFQPGILRGVDVGNQDGYNTIFHSILKKQKATQPDGKPSQCSLPAGSDDFNAILYETSIGTEKVFYNEHYHPDLAIKSIEIAYRSNEPLIRRLQENLAAGHYDEKARRGIEAQIAKEFTIDRIDFILVEKEMQ